MKARRLSVFVAALCTAAVIVSAQQPDQVSVPLTDPGRPASLNLRLVTGSITVRGSARRDVLVIARARGQNQDAGGGLRRLAQAPGFRVEEARNQVTIESQSVTRAIDFEIQVPSRTDLKIGTVNSGEILVEGVDGELEVENVNGSITLNRVGGSIVANTVNGRVIATITSVPTQRPMAFTSLNGNVDVTFPNSLKANLRLRSDNGDVLMGFDLTPLQQPLPTIQDTRRDGGRFRIEVNRLLYGSVNGGGPEIELRTFNGNVIVRRGQ